ncbi:hypothetical protein [Nostoc sp.]|uniref:hypothetical protein n=1 Tax=Nostoc sp. TaxID=1180 RepID=UPI002FFA5F5E
MEQQDQTRHKALNIHPKKDGELNLSGLTLKNLSSEEFLVVQQLIDESKVRSQSNRQIEELMQRGMMAQTAQQVLDEAEVSGTLKAQKWLHTKFSRHRLKQLQSLAEMHKNQLTYSQEAMKVEEDLQRANQGVTWGGGDPSCLRFTGTKTPVGGI